MVSQVSSLSVTGECLKVKDHYEVNWKNQQYSEYEFKSTSV